VIGWSVLEKELDRVCKRSVEDAAGRPAYHPLVLFKMMLPQTWSHRSDMSVEDMVHDTLSAKAFLVYAQQTRYLTIARAAVLGASYPRREFMHRLLAKRNAQLAQQGVWVQQGGGMIDASITPTACKAQRKSTYMLPEHPNTPLAPTSMMG
jgi:transposase, IS5 family